MPGGCTQPSATGHQQNLKPNSPSRRLSLKRIAGPARRVHSTRFRALDTGLGFERMENAVLLEVVSGPRTKSDKAAFYENLCHELANECAVPPSDLMISFVENTDEDWSFGLGGAQFLEGDLWTTRSSLYGMSDLFGQYWTSERATAGTRAGLLVRAGVPACDKLNKEQRDRTTTEMAADCGRSHLG
ncbi:tautomerase family protein [Rhizobium miluonense]|uniref:Tautomerase enzyme n=1 Tax=Rhizobium miluonense TaxID=411945 RepID=A0A1C3V5F2_9HYPH|nr:Tautomerase enzyme [Rhizobium miluonense]